MYMKNIDNLIIKNVFNIQLSWYLIPLLLILWYNYPQSHKIFAILMICIVIIGLIETLFFSSISTIGKILNIICHLLLLIPLYFSEQNFNTLSAINNWNVIVYILGIIIMLYLPYWPYKMDRMFLLTLYSVITLSLWLHAVKIN